VTTTIIFGNGLGMAIDPEYFTLETGLRFVTEELTDEERNIICFNQNGMPRTEPELESHHKILTSCRTLLHYQSELNCLSDIGMNFPNTYQNFIYRAAKYFFDYQANEEYEQFNNFIDALCNYIKSGQTCHIATLNYDKLLYKPLIDRKILSDYDGFLVDGMYVKKGGFDFENLIPKWGNNFGWYLHLHGSPIFYTGENRVINKEHIFTLPSHYSHNGHLHNHIVLASTEVKPYLIAGSMLLDYYFQFFTYALSSSDNLLLFGYSGLDRHVNLAIKERLVNDDTFPVDIHIIEWGGDKNQRERADFWKKTVGSNNYKKNINLRLMDNILEYDFSAH